MFNSFDICVALECVKKIYDNNRCTVCDKADGQFMRYPCGHITCNVCASKTEYCLFCLTPPEKTTSNNSSFDELSTRRSINASVLLNAFEKAFNVDVYKHHKMSEQLKLEKDLFPECIQAPNKYFNKRKSSNSYVKNSLKKKKNQLSELPGEVIYPDESNRMTSSNHSVEQWLNQNKKNSIKEQLNKNENEESGIDIDVSFIDCTQITEDKDQQALIAVYEADKNEQMTIQSDSVLTVESKVWEEDNEITSDHINILKNEYKVPFLKKSKLAKTHTAFNSGNSLLKISTNMFNEDTKIQITIFNNESPKHNEHIQSRLTSENTVPVQTEICGILHAKDNNQSKEDIYLEDCTVFKESCKSNSEDPSLNIFSQDVFTFKESQEYSNAKTSNIKSKAPSKSIVIQESDSDDGSVPEVKILEVSAQVHRFEYPVLTDITYTDRNEDVIGRQNRRRRRLTPDSSNSSEKENLNPNRPKRSKYGKKSKK